MNVPNARTDKKNGDGRNTFSRSVAVYRITEHKSNEGITEELEIEGMMMMVMINSKRKWLNHLERTPDNQIPKLNC